MTIESKELVKRHRVISGKGFALREVDPSAIEGGAKLKARAARALKNAVQVIAQLQEKLYAEDRHALLLIFQAMDAAGKDSTIKHVMSGIDPHGCQIHGFKLPTSSELDHDFLWRAVKVLPERGHIGIFSRSYYEEVTTVRVHRELLKNQRLPAALVTKNIWQQRYEDINNFERYLTHNGVVVRKFFLHISKVEQKQRLLARLDDPKKTWKFALEDLRARDHWDEYMHAYQDMIRNTASTDAPWFAIPADHKWYARLVVAQVVVETLRSLRPEFPKIDRARRKELITARALLSAKTSGKNKATGDG